MHGKDGTNTVASALEACNTFNALFKYLGASLKFFNASFLKITRVGSSVISFYFLKKIKRMSLLPLAQKTMELYSFLHLI